jgi:23S rRNA (uridine2552-2'-O)-methyltransferase
LDLGAAPGGFLQILARAVGPSGRVIGVDRVPIRPLSLAQIKTAVLDVLAPQFLEEVNSLHEGLFDAVVSDLAPKTTGIRATDEAKSLELAAVALRIGQSRGRAGSSLVAKLFMGGDFESFRNEVRAVYKDVKVVRPEATRSQSMEVYLVGLGHR